MKRRPLKPIPMPSAGRQVQQPSGCLWALMKWWFIFTVLPGIFLAMAFFGYAMWKAWVR